MAAQRTRILVAALILGAALQISTVSAQGKKASIESSTKASSDDADGFARASLNLKITDGTGKAVAIATSDTFSKAKSEIITIIQRVSNNIPHAPKPLDKSTYCPEVEGIIEIDAQAVGLAAAGVTVNVVSEIEIDGEGSGCANTEASGSAFAVAFAKLFVDAIVEVGIYNINTATADALLAAKGDAFAAAFAKGTAEACLRGPGYVLAQDTIEAKAIARPVASILVFLEAFVDCSGFADAFVDAEVGVSLNDVAKPLITSTDPLSIIQGKGTAETLSEAEAVMGRLCSGDVKSFCCNRRKGRSLKDGEICFCNSKNEADGAKCGAKKTVFGDDSASYEDQKLDIICAC